MQTVVINLQNKNKRYQEIVFNYKEVNYYKTSKPDFSVHETNKVKIQKGFNINEKKK